MKVVRKIIEIDEDKCNGCGNCVTACAEGAIEIIDGKAKVIRESLCDGLGACIGDCPEDALHIIEREADEFDEQEVHIHLEELKKRKEESSETSCGCPSTQIQAFGSPSTCQTVNKASVISGTEADSALRHWPVQIRLVPPTAPFLKGSDLLIAADCVPFAYPDLHKNYLTGRSVMIGCPKFDDSEEYIKKFTEIFKTAQIKSVTIILMEVPCCSALNTIVKKALELSGADIPVTEVIVGIKGGIS